MQFWVSFVEAELIELLLFVLYIKNIAGIFELALGTRQYAVLVN
jgi:hypothetical protein